MASLIFLSVSAGGMGGREEGFHCTILSLIQVVSVEEPYQTDFVGTLGSVAVCVPLYSLLVLLLLLLLHSLPKCQATWASRTKGALPPLPSIPPFPLPLLPLPLTEALIKNIFVYAN